MIEYSVITMPIKYLKPSCVLKYNCTDTSKLMLSLNDKS